MDSLFNSLKNFCIEHGFDRTYWVAFSGGLDSTVLLHSLVNLRSLYPIRLKAIHIHHGLSPNADEWEESCQKTCYEFAVEFISRRVDVTVFPGQSPEEIARQCRYEMFSQLISPIEILLTGHHQDDQAETILLQLFRGAGPRGLSAMSRFMPFQHGYLARPLLDFPRNALQQYAEQNQLSWIEDESNANKHFTRNFIRHDVLTLLKSRWPNVTESLTRSAKHCAEAQELLDSVGYQDLAMCYGSKPNTLSAKKILQLSESRQRQVIRLWLREENFTIPSTIKMQHIIKDVLHAREDKLPHIIWGNNEMRRYRDDLYIMPCLSPVDTSVNYTWDLQQPLEIPGIGTLDPQLIGINTNISSATVRFRRGGETIQLPGRSHHHELKKLFQSWGIPPWQRDRTPLIFVNDELAVVVGYCVADGY